MELRDEINQHMARTGEKQIDLARRAGVFPSVISRILSEKQEDVNGRNYRAITKAIQEYAPDA